LGADVDQKIIIDTVTRYPVVFHHTYHIFRDAGLIAPALLPVVAANNVYDMPPYVMSMLSWILIHEELPETVLSLLGRCRFQSSQVYSLLSGASCRNRPRSFKFIFERTSFEPDHSKGPFSKDEMCSGFLKMAFMGDNLELIHFMLSQDFRIINGYSLLRMWSAATMDNITQLLWVFPKRVAELCPKPKIMELCEKPESALSAINFASSCDPANFNPSAFLASLVQNRRYYFLDTDMLSVIRRLCELGARVERSTCETFDKFHKSQDYPESRQALLDYAAQQDDDIEGGEIEID
jgi:hypothetical protein